MIRKNLLAFVILITFPGCYSDSSDELGPCTLNLVAAIGIEIHEQGTGLPISCGATVMIHDGGYQEEISNPAGHKCDDSRKLFGAYERPGNYTLSVMKNGYFDWSQSDIVVTEGDCHVNSVTIKSYLVKIT